MQQTEKRAMTNGFDRRYHDYHDRYVAWKKKGKPWFPYVLYEDAVVAALVLGLLLALIVFAGVPTESQADPTNTSYVPRPEWYFMFLFEMLKFFPGELEWVGVVVVPGIMFAALLLLPWIDRGPWRIIKRRPLIALATTAGLVATVFLTVQAFQSTPVTAETGRKLSPIEAAGKKLYQAQNCGACHVLQGQGGTVGPSLDDVGSRRDVSAIHQYIENPKRQNPNAAMPQFLPPLTHQEVDQIAVYLGGFK
ncbi:MAG: c-type cytochrome [Chloroflexota bacterium]|nr:MAG: c-type cytochrome [Chloroflexota bacterium]